MDRKGITTGCDDVELIEGKSQEDNAEHHVSKSLRFPRICSA